MEQTKILFIPTCNAGVSYWRMWNFANGIHRNGYGATDILWYDKKQVDLAPWEIELQAAYDADSYVPQYKITNEMWQRLRQADAVVFGMVHTQSAIDLIESVLDIRRAGHLRYVPVLMEMDDNILSVPTQNPAYAAYAPGSEIRRITERQMRISDGIIVSTPYLRDVFRDYNENVYVVPNSVDFKMWGKLKNKPKPGIRIGWSGGSAHAEDLATIEEVIPRILDAHKDAKFVFVHGIAPFMFDLEKKYPGRVELHKEWTFIDKYPAKIASLDFDITMAPLIDSAFNRGKSNLRWLEAAALGIPCVASNVGHFAETIENNVDGLLCDSEDDWFKNLSRLITDKRLRQGIGMRARATAEYAFNIDKTSQTYVDSVIACGNSVADRAVIAAQKALEVRESENEHDQSAVADSCLADGGGPAAEPVF